MDDVIREVGVLTGKSDTEILRLFQDAGLSGMLQDAKPLLQAGKLKNIGYCSFWSEQRTMEAAAEKCRGEIGNLTLTTAIATQQEYMQTLNAAYMKVTSGAFFRTRRQSDRLSGMRQSKEHRSCITVGISQSWIRQSELLC